MTIAKGEISTEKINVINTDGQRYNAYIVNIDSSTPPFQYNPSSYQTGDIILVPNKGGKILFDEGIVCTAYTEDDPRANENMYVPKTVGSDYTDAINGTLGFKEKYRIKEGDQFPIQGGNVGYGVQGFVVSRYFVFTTQPTLSCFLGDAPILTPHGYKRIDSLNKGDMVITADGRRVPIIYISKQQTEPSPSTNPYIIPKGKWGALTNVALSPAHRVSVPNRGMFCASTLRLSQATMTAPWIYYNLVLPNWHTDNLIVAGLNVESLSPYILSEMQKKPHSKKVWAKMARK